MAGFNEKSESVPHVTQLEDGEPRPTRQEGKDVSTENVTEDHTSLKDDEKSQSHPSGSSPDLDGHVTDEDNNDTESPDEPPIRPQASRASSVFSRGAVVVPRSQRRGLFGRFAAIPELERPYDYTNRTKWTLTAIVALAAGAAPMGSAIFYPALPQMAADLNTTATITNLAVAMYMLAMSIFPLWWSSFSETLGRRTIYLTSFALFVVFGVLSAISVNISMLIVMRILAGGAAASVQAVGAGTIADIWETHHRGRAMGIFYLGPLTGPLFAPIIGGALAQGFGWRATMWFLVIYGGLTLLLIFFCLPETLDRKKMPLSTSATAGATPAPDADADADADAALARSTTRQSLAEASSFARRLFVDPLSVLAYLRFPPVAITVYCAAICFGSLFVMNISIQSAFSQPPYGFSEVITGLMYFPPSLGYVGASTIGGRWLDVIMAREARRAGRFDEDGKLRFLPEDRMRENMWLAASLYPAALVWFGWTIQHGIHWIVPSIANFFFGFGSMLVFGACTTVLTEFMPKRSSSGVAVNNFVRNIFSCVGGIVTQPLIDVMGIGWLCTMVGLFAWITGNLAILALRKKGGAWRIKMDEAMNKST